MLVKRCLIMRNLGYIFTLLITQYNQIQGQPGTQGGPDKVSSLLSETASLERAISQFHDDVHRHFDSAQASTDGSDASHSHVDAASSITSEGNTRQITDIYGNALPSPSGIHVDLPGEHCNTNDFAVVHHGSHCDTSSSNVVNFQSKPGVSHQAAVNPPAAKVDDFQFQPEVVSQSALGVQSTSKGLNNGMGLDPSKGGLFAASNVHNNPNLVQAITKEFLDLSIETGNIPVAAVHNSPPPVISSGAAPDAAQILGQPHVDFPGEHGNTADVPVFHDPSVNLDQSQALGSSHVDHPGEHGNTANVAVVHRDGVLDGSGFPVDRPNLLGSSHVDLPGEHGNIANVPVVHRDGVSNGAGVHVGQPNLLGSSHVDLPGEHGNIANVPVVHRDGVLNGAGVHVGQTNLLGSSHVDLPGEHGNLANVPVVHRDGVLNGAGVHVGQPNLLGSSHVDLPGEHGNIANVPLVHREPNVMNGGVHVDHPGEHGNTANVAVLHRPGGNDVHVDLPGQHGNDGDVPVIHRPNGGMHVDQSGAHHSTGTNHIGNHPQTVSTAHVVMPGEHGNNSPVPVIHVVGAGSNQRLPMPGFGNMAPSEAIGSPVSGLSVNDHTGEFPGIMNQGHSPQHPIFGHDKTGIHIDQPGEHGNNMGEPALHVPAGTNVADLMNVGSQVNGGFPGILNQGQNLHQPGFGHENTGVHINHPGQHGNNMGESSLHVSTGSHAADLNNGGLAVNSLIPGNGGFPGTMNQGHNPHHPMFGHDKTGVHIDQPGGHGNTMGEPALHVPTGTNVAHFINSGQLPPLNPAFGNGIHNKPIGILPGFPNGIKPGVQPGFMPGVLNGVIPGVPHGLMPVVSTGVLPGTPNIALPPRRPHMVNILRSQGPSVNGLIPSLGDILGLPTVNIGYMLQRRRFLVGRNNPDPRLLGPAVLRDYDPEVGVRQRGGHWNDGHHGHGECPRGRRGRRCRRRQRQERRRKLTTTTTTHKPVHKPHKPSGNGITVIRTTRRNPLQGLLGNVIRNFRGLFGG